MPSPHSRPNSTEIDPPVPYSEEAERSVLGAVLLDNCALAKLTDLVPAHFYRPLHAAVFSTMRLMLERGESIDCVTLNEALQELSHEELAYVASIADGLPRVSNVEHYARIVREKSSLREVIRTAQTISERAFARGADARELAKQAADLLTTLRDAPAADWRSVFHSWDEFESAAPLSFAIRGFLQNAGATMIGGLSGHGKTLILLSITKALLLGRGNRLWELFDVEEENARALYLVPESSIEPFKHRLKLFGIYPYLAPDSERLLVRTLSKGLTPSLSDSRILQAAKGAHVLIDTAIRFASGDENDASDNQQLAKDIFALLGAGARSVIAAHHSPKPFAKETVMTLENVLRGSGDIGAMLTTAWGVKQLDAENNLLHLQNIKPRDFQPCGPFQIIGRPHIDKQGDFALYKHPGECGALADEQEPARDKGGAPTHVREERAARIELMRQWREKHGDETSDEISARFKAIGMDVSPITVRKYRREVEK